MTTLTQTLSDKLLRLGLALIASFFAAGAAHAAPAPAPLTFWHTQSTDRGALLAKIIADYNATNPAIPVEGVYQGTYDDIYRKTKANLIAKNPPDMVVAYESMVPEYMRLRPLADLDPLIKDPKSGLSRQELDDFFPVFLQDNRYPQFDNQMLSFPFTKSLMILFVNDDLVKKAGFSGPPHTWDEFEKQCLAMRKIGKKGYAMDKDASTLDGMFMSRGAKLLDADGKTTAFDSLPVVQTFDYLHRLVTEGAAYEIEGANDEDVRDFAAGNCAFFIKSSTRRPTIRKTVGTAFKWSMNPLPAGEGQPPMTVLYGGNISVFSNGDERVKAAWQFIKYFTSPEVTARWAVGSGYLPVRRSAEKLKTMQDFFAEYSANRQVFDMIPLGRFEPAPAGWQEVREYVQQTVTDAIIGREGKTPEQLAKDLKARADAKLTPASESSPKGKGTTIRVLLVILLLAGIGLVVRFFLKPSKPTSAD